MNRKLTLRKDVTSDLTPDELRSVAGGGETFTWFPCPFPSFFTMCLTCMTCFTWESCICDG